MWCKIEIVSNHDCLPCRKFGASVDKTETYIIGLIMIRATRQCSQCL